MNPQGHVPLGVIGLPADDFKVRTGSAVTHQRSAASPSPACKQHSPCFAHCCRCPAALHPAWNRHRDRAVAAMKCLMDGLYRFFNSVSATTPFVASCDRLSLLRIRSLYFLSLSPTQAGALKAITKQRLQATPAQLVMLQQSQTVPTGHEERESSPQSS